MYFDMYGNYRPDDRIYERIIVGFGSCNTYIIGAKEVDQISPGKKEDPDCDEYVSPEICRYSMIIKMKYNKGQTYFTRNDYLVDD